MSRQRLDSTVPVILLVFLLLSSVSFASVPHVMSVQGKATNKATGALLTAGNITIRIYDSSAGGNLIFNDTYNNTIYNGTFNVLLGSQIPLNLTYNRMYYMEIGINTETVIGSASRREFFATGGPNQTIMNVEENIGYVNITSQSASQPALRVIGASSQTANLTEWLNNGVTPLAYISSRGGAFFNQSVGIGISAPTSKLHVSGNATITSLASCNTIDTNANGDLACGSDESGMAVWSNTTTAIYNNSAGVNVGIGTATPTAALEINGSANILALNVNNTLYVNTTSSYVGIGTSSPSAKLSVAGNISVSQNALLAMQATNNYVGIGKSSPNYKLDVLGQSGITQIRFGDADENSGGFLTSYSSGQAIVSGGRSRNGVNWIARSTSASAIMMTTNNIVFETDSGLTSGNAFTPTERMRLAGNNLGIATQSPTASLEVNGSANILALNVNNTLYVNTTNSYVGIGTSSPEFALSFGADGGILAKGTYGSGATLQTSGAGTRLIWYPRKAAFRVGYATSAQWDDVNIGTYSTAMGYGTNASGAYSTAMGFGTKASGAYYSTAMGEATTASGNYASTALGAYTTANGDYATAMGRYTTASGYASTAMGNYATASGDYSIAMGESTTASGSHSLAAGYYVTAGAAANAIVLGQGVDAFNQLTNNAASSLMVGFNSTVPTLFVGPGSGAGTTGSVGIGTASPNAKLEVNGSASVSGFLNVSGAIKNTATRIVAASNTANATVRADYIGNGVNDEAAINNAISSLPPEGGTVYLLEGTYNITSSVNLSSNVSLIGSGAGTLLRLNDSNNRNINITSVSSKSSVLLYNFKINGNRGSQSSGTQYAVYFFNTTNSSVVRLQIENLRSRGISIETSSTYNSISETIIRNTATDISVSSSSNNVIRDNVLQSSSGGTSVSLTSSDFNQVKGNDIRASNGISLSAADSNNVAGNLINTPLYGITLSSSDYNIIGENVVKSASADSIQLSGSAYNSVLNNVLYDLAGGNDHHIYLMDSSNYNTISGNVANYGGLLSSIVIENSNGSVVTSNVIDEVGSNDNGIYIRSASNTVIASNFIHDTSNANYGINIENAASSNNYLVGNEITGAGFVSDVYNNGTNTTIQHRDLFQVGNTLLVNDTSGNAGIGTSAPYRKLQVNGTFETNESAYFATASGQKVGIGNTVPTATLDVAGSANALALNANNTLYVNTTSSGVGIGTTSPSAKLSVSHELDTGTGLSISLSSSSSPTGLSISNNYVDTTYTAISIPNIRQSGTGISIFQGGNRGGSAVGIAITGTASAGGDDFTGDWLRINPSSITVNAGLDFIDRGNYIDVNRSHTVSSTDTLNITGDLVTFSSICRQSSGICRDTSNILSLAQNYINASGEVLMITNNGTGLSLRVNDDGTETDSTPFIIDANGNVGIGASSPASSLEINGSANVLALNVNNTLYVNTTASRIGIGSTNPNTKLESVGLPGAKIALTKTDSGAAPTSISFANSYLHLGGAEWNTNSYRLMTFGFTTGTETNPPAYFGFQETDASGKSYGDLVIGTRSVTTDTAAIERMRITGAGNIGINTTSPQSLLDVRGYIQLNITGSAPPAGDCDSVAEAGRMVIFDNGSGCAQIYVCDSDTSSAGGDQPGWVAFTSSSSCV